MTEPITAERLLQHIRELPTKRAARGDAAHIAGLRETEQQLHNKLTAMGYIVQLDPIDFIGRPREKPPEQRKDGDPKPESGDPSRAGAPRAMPSEPPAIDRAEPPKPWHNLIVEIPGQTSPKHVLIVGAHFDAVPNSPGADDNGTGVATLLEAARVLKDQKLARTVRLVFFNLEEVGLVGSRAYVERLKSRIDAKDETIVGMISLEMLGYYSTAAESQKSPLPPVGDFQPPTVGDFIAIVGVARHQSFSRALDKAMRAAEPGAKTFVVDFLPIAPPDLLRSDHAPFLLAGLPAVMLTDTANFRNPHYHKPTDRVETLDAERFTTTARAVVAAVRELANKTDATPAPANDSKQDEPEKR